MHNIGILLAAGLSSRFGNPPKQLFELNNKPIISHSGDLLSECLDELVIVTNSKCHPEVVKLFKTATILVNDVNCRLHSIKAALDHIGQRKKSNLVIHDSARPFITKEHLVTLINARDNVQHAQYCLKLTNGLVKMIDGLYEVVDRDQHLELCAPQITEYQLFYDLFNEHIWTKAECEILPLVSKLKIPYRLIEGNNRYLRKITTLEDL